MMSDIDTKMLEKVINEMYPGLTMYVRDLTLSPQCLAQYQAGIIIKEKAFVDTSQRVGGMTTPHRISILSNHMSDLKEFDQGMNWGLCVANRDSRFKVIDVFEHKGKTQILLLHLPDNECWTLFKNVILSIDKNLIEECRKRFMAKCHLKPIPELAAEEWLMRCDFPVGMDDHGNLHDIDDQLLCVKDMNFRAMYHAIAFIKCPELLEKMTHLFKAREIDNGYIVYGYIDDETGFTFEILSCAYAEENQISFGKVNNQVSAKLHVGSIKDCTIIPLDKDNLDMTEYAQKIMIINNSYAVKEPSIRKMRDIQELDACRNENFPDDILTYLFKEGLQPERLWLRCNKIDDEQLFGSILNEPNQNFGVHIGDIINFGLAELDGECICVAKIE